MCRSGEGVYSWEVMADLVSGVGIPHNELAILRGTDQVPERERERDRECVSS